MFNEWLYVCMYVCTYDGMYICMSCHDLYLCMYVCLYGMYVGAQGDQGAGGKTTSLQTRGEAEQARGEDEQSLGDDEGVVPGSEGKAGRSLQVGR